MRVIPPITQNLSQWGENLRRYLASALNQLDAKDASSVAAEDGVILWDRTYGYPVVSKNGEWRQIVLEDGHYDGTVSTNQTAASINTAYALTFTQDLAEGITNGTPASRLIVTEAGQYSLTYSMQMASTSAATVTMWFWTRINGTDISKSAMENTLHQNGSTLVVTKSAILQLSAGDYIEIMWATDSTSGYLEAVGATSFAPATPSATISIVRLHG
tara:strand:+ start:1506 stop:2153 length:648 start_codon:yes stop_codon:yes gene_type:complete